MQKNAVQVYLLSPGQVVEAASHHAAACFEQMRIGFTLQFNTAHTLVPDPESADLILAPIQGEGYGPCFEALRHSTFHRDYANKLVVYSTDDNQFPALRGLYPAVARRWVRRGWALPAHYVSAHFHQFSFRPEELQNKDILFSFVGSSQTHRIRKRIVEWRHRDGVVIDASKGEKNYWWQGTNKDHFLDSFRQITRRSKFVICPRGFSPSSIRLFEAMEAGAVPVIIADDLELPVGPNWNEFSLRVRERDLDEVPHMVERAQERASGMGAAARRVWESYFSPQATVGSLVGWALQLLAQGDRRPALLVFAEYTGPRLVKEKLRHVLDRRSPASG